MSSVLHYIQRREVGSRLREDKIFLRQKLATDEHLHKKVSFYDFLFFLFNNFSI